VSLIIRPFKLATVSINLLKSSSLDLVIDASSWNLSGGLTILLERVPPGVPVAPRAGIVLDPL
jgi:hypothetical protein